MVTHTWVNRQRASTDVDPFRVRAANDPKIVLRLEQVKQESQQMEHCSLVSGIFSAAIRAVPRWLYILIKTTAQFRSKFSQVSSQRRAIWNKPMVSESGSTA